MCSAGRNGVGTARGQERPAELPNPASVYCQEHGSRLTVVGDADGGQRDVCVFPDGSSCDEWAFHRGECEPSEPSRS